MVITHRNSPVGHGAVWFRHGNRGKGFLGLFIPERMQEGRGSIELLLSGRRCRTRLKFTRPSFSERLMRMRVHLLRSPGRAEKRHEDYCDKQTTELHRQSPLFKMVTYCSDLI